MGNGVSTLVGGTVSEIPDSSSISQIVAAVIICFVKEVNGGIGIAVVGILDDDIRFDLIKYPDIIFDIFFSIDSKIMFEFNSLNFFSNELFSLIKIFCRQIPPPKFRCQRFTIKK